MGRADGSQDGPCVTKAVRGPSSRPVKLGVVFATAQHFWVVWHGLYLPIAVRYCHVKKGDGDNFFIQTTKVSLLYAKLCHSADIYNRHIETSLKTSDNVCDY